MDPQKLEWQSKLILLAVAPWLLIATVFATREWGQVAPEVPYWVLGLSALLGLLAWLARSGTAAASETGALITASLMFSTTQFPYNPFRTALTPLLTVLVLTTLATRFGRHRKERFGTAERRQGRNAAQVAANLGVAALVSLFSVQMGLADGHLFRPLPWAPLAIFIPAMAALAEAAADTLASELGQVLGGTPFMMTTMRRVEPGTDGGITVAGTLAGVAAAGLVAAAGIFALGEGFAMQAVIWAAGVFGLFFDSLLGATLERKGWLNNDGVNFISTASAAAFALLILAMLPHAG